MTKHECIRRLTSLKEYHEARYGGIDGEADNPHARGAAYAFRQAIWAVEQISDKSHVVSTGFGCEVHSDTLQDYDNLIKDIARSAVQEYCETVGNIHDKALQAEREEV